MTRAFLFVVALMLLVGCGGSDISKADFVKKANKICVDGDKKTANLAPKAGATQKDIEKLISDKVVPNIQKQFDDIRDLGFPKADKDKLDTLFDKAQTILDKVKKDPAGALGSSNPFAAVAPGLKAYGLTSCGAG